MFPTEMKKGDNFDDYLTRSKKAASYLRILNHSKSCKGSCGQSTCRQTYRLLQHAEDCNPNGNYLCEIKGCCTTKKLLAHVFECNAKVSIEGERKALCLVCTLASMPANASASKEDQGVRNALTSSEADKSGPHCVGDVLMNSRQSGRRDKACFKNSCRSHRSSTMVDNSEAVKENTERGLHLVTRAPFSQIEMKVAPSSSLSTPQIQDLSLDSTPRLTEFIVPTMIPKRFRSNTLQHVATNDMKIIVRNRDEDSEERSIGFAKEKWFCVDNISRKIRVGQA
jgi:TAZ zinc finger